MRGRLLLLLLAVGELLLCPVVEPANAPRHLQVERHGHHGVEAWHPKDYTIVPSGASSKKEAHRAKGKEDLLAEIVARRAKVKHEHELGPSTSTSPPPPPPPPPTVPPPHSRSSNSTTANIGAKRRPPVGVFIHCSCTTRWKETLDELVLGVLGGGEPATAPAPPPPTFSIVATPTTPETIPPAHLTPTYYVHRRPAPQASCTERRTLRSWWRPTPTRAPWWS